MSDSWLCIKMEQKTADDLLTTAESYEIIGKAPKFSSDKQIESFTTQIFNKIIGFTQNQVLQDDYAS